MAFNWTTWPQGQAVWKQNLSDPSDPDAVSLSDGRDGLIGCDICYGIYLNPTKLMTVQGDCWWPTGPNKTRVDPDGAGPIGGSPLIRNSVCIFEGADWLSANQRGYCGNVFNDPRPFFDVVDPVAWGRYPMAGVRIDDNQVLVVGMIHMGNNWAAIPGEGGPAGTYPIGSFATMLIGDIDGAYPDTWKQVDIDVKFTREPNGGLKGLPAGIGQGVGYHFGPGLWIEGEYLISVVQGPWDQTGHWSISRFPMSEVRSHLLINPEWLSPGGDWVRDLQSDDGFIEQYRYRITPDDSTHEQGGSIYPMTNGQYIAACVPSDLYDADPRVSASVRSNLKGKFPAWDRFFDLPLNTGGSGHVAFDYGAYIYMGDVAKWAGMGVNDQLWMVSQNVVTSDKIFGNMNEYWPLMGKVTGAPAPILPTRG